jgi:arginine utilization protein RocB
LGWNPAPKRYIEQQLTSGDEPHAAEPFDEPQAAERHKAKLQKTENPDWEPFMLKVSQAKYDELVTQVKYIADINDEQKKLNYLASKSNYEKIEAEFTQLIKDQQV